MEMKTRETPSKCPLWTCGLFPAYIIIPQEERRAMNMLQPMKASSYMMLPWLCHVLSVTL